MEFIKLFILGLAGYILALLYDLSILHAKYLLQKITFLGFFITALPYLFLPFVVSSPFSPVHLLYIIPLLLLCILLLVFSVFLEPIKASKEETGLYEKGTYSFSRHPGFLWYTTINCLIAIYFYDIRVTFLVMGFTLCNLLLILIEDRIIFPRMFDGYEEYKQNTPFLISLDRLLGRRRKR